MAMSFIHLRDVLLDSDIFIVLSNIQSIQNISLVRNVKEFNVYIRVKLNGLQIEKSYVSITRLRDVCSWGSKMIVLHT